MDMRKLMTSLLALAVMVIAVSTARAQVITDEICSPNTAVSANGFFNIDVSCNPGEVVITGGYSCSCNAGANLLPVTVEVNTFFGGFVGGPFPNGWQTIGQTLASAVGHSDTFACVNKSSGEVKIVPSCTVGTNASPCHNNDICTDLSGQSSPSACSAAGSNPSCQVCITCAGLPG